MEREVKKSEIFGFANLGFNFNFSKEKQPNHILLNLFANKGNQPNRFFSELQLKSLIHSQPLFLKTNLFLDQESSFRLNLVHPIEDFRIVGSIRCHTDNNLGSNMELLVE